MANKTIPQLPQQTTVIDGDIIAIVDSGQTTTSHITRSDYLGKADITTTNIRLTGNPGDIESTGGIGISNNSSTAQGAYGVSIGSRSTLTCAGVAIGGRTLTTATYGVVVGGRNNSQAGSYATTVGGFGNNSNNYGVAIGGINNNGSSMIGYEGIFGGFGNNVTTTSTQYCNIYGGGSNTINNGSLGVIVGGSSNQIAPTSTGTYYSNIFGGTSNSITSTGTKNNILGGQNNTIAGTDDNVAMINCSGRTGTAAYTTYVETLEAFDGIVMTDYANLNFTGDTAAAAGGVPLGGLYHDAGAMRIRIT